VIVGVADTYTALWYLYKNPRLSVTARSFMDDAAAGGHHIALCPISLDGRIKSSNVLTVW
jgi:hypothetical protein